MDMLNGFPVQNNWVLRCCLRWRFNGSQTSIRQNMYQCSTTGQWPLSFVREPLLFAETHPTWTTADIVQIAW